MCGIFVYSGNTNNAGQQVIKGLKTLEYRGYDSWGIAYLVNKGIKIEKNVGVINPTNKKIQNCNIAIGHTRWATHGGVNTINAHPHMSSDYSFALVQNGIVENFEELKSSLIKKNYKFITETDTEVIVRLIEDNLKINKDIIKASIKAFNSLKGRNTIALLTKEGLIIAIRNGSPLIIGINEKNNSFYLSSDVISLSNLATHSIFVNNKEMVVYRDKKFNIYDVISLSKKILKKNKLIIHNAQTTKNKYKHYMLKEINDTPQAITSLLNFKINDYSPFIGTLRNSNNVYTIGSGTAGIAASQIAYYLRTLAKINATSLIGAEANDYINLFNKNDIIIAPSQSGETADVLEVLETAKKRGVKIASFVNMPESLMTRISDFPFMANAGPEICVMSTKIFTSQISWGYLVSKILQNKTQEGIKNLLNTSKLIQSYLTNTKNHKVIKKIAKLLSLKKDIFLLSKGQNLQITKEGMVKIIEGSYLHAHGIPAGDLKHYAITLIEPGVPVIFIISNDEFKTDLKSSINEIKARGGYIIGISPEKLTSFDNFIQVPELTETSSMINIIPLQLLAYYLSLELGNNIDKPRNIAKSVTVK